MAIRPDIILAGRQAPDIGAAFNNALLNVQRGQQISQQREQAPIQNRLLEAQTGQAEAGVVEGQQLNNIRSLAVFGSELLGDIQSGNLEAIRAKTVQRIAQLPSQGLPSNDSQELLQLIDDPSIAVEDKIAQIGQLAQQANQTAIQFGAIKAPTAASTRSSAPITDPVTGQVSIPTFNPATNTVQLLPVEGAIQLTPRQKVDLEIEQAQGKAEATQRASRVSQITTELSTRGRQAKRAEINLAQAATLVERATQGAAGASKLRLSKLFPGIDVSNEAALSQSLTNLALDELQKFKGPTTDFEFQKTEQIAGTLGDSKTANRAKVASLQRANWFVQRESRQFLDHVKAGKSPDTFGFDFGEQINTKKGNFSLQDLQDTAVSNNISIKETLKRLNK